MPSTIYIISDMEFDQATTNNTETNFFEIKRKYESSGYIMPQLVFWNVDSKQNNIPVLKDTYGTLLVSGASPVIFKMVLEKTTPLDFMLNTINSPRYKPIEDILNNEK